MDPPSDAFDKLGENLFLPTDPPAGEGLFGEAALSKGWITDVRLRECLEEQRELREAGREEPLGQILLRRGYLTTPQFVEILALQKRRSPTCSSCGRPCDIGDLPAGTRLRCLGCGEELPVSGGPVPQAVQDQGWRRVGRYELIREIARGGMATVFEARDPQLARRVALKVLREGESEPEPIRRLHREAAIAARLQHPNIVGIHEVGTATDGSGQATHFIAMDYIEGPTLAGLLQEGKTPREERLRMVEETARAVAYAHAKGVIHRDLKPSNILVDPGGRVVLTDFGLAHAGGFSTRLTQSHSVLGTPQYMAPEQVEGKTALMDAKTDVYALGVLLYEVLVGRTPFHAETPARLYRRIVDDEPERPSRVDPSIDRDLERICLRAMEKDRRNRTATALEFAEDLSRFRKGEPILARSTRWWDRVRKRLARRKAVVAVILLGGIAPVAAILLGTRFADLRAFRNAKAEGDSAYASGEWIKAEAAYERALLRRSDAAISERVVRCRSMRAREKEETERRLEEEKLYRQFQEDRMQPVQAKLQELRPLLCNSKLDVVRRLRELEPELEELERRTEGGPFARFADPWTLLGVGWVLVGDRVRAEEALLRAVERSPKDGRAHFALGKVYQERSMEVFLNPAREPEEEIRKRSGEWGDKARRHLEDSQQGWGGAQPIDLHIASAYTALLRGDSSEALRLCEEGLQRFGSEPGAEEYWNLRGCVMASAEALDCYARALAIRPHYAWGWYRRAFLRQGIDPDGAANDCSKAIKYHPKFVEAFALRALIRKRQGNLAKAMGDCTESLRRNPHYAEAYVIRGEVYEAQGNPTAAIADYTTALTLLPRFVGAYNSRGIAKASQGDWSGAILDYTSALRINPRYVEAYNNRGVSHHALKDYEEAIADYSEAIRLHDRPIVEYVNRGLAREAKGDLAGAIVDYGEALRLDPKNPEIYRRRGRAHHVLSQWDLAASDLSAALDCAPADWPHRGRVQRTLEASRERRLLPIEDR